MNLSRSISTEMWLARKLCTIVEGATMVEAVTAGNLVRLYQRLSALGATEKSLAKTLNQYIMESEMVRKNELEKCSRELRKYQQALESHASSYEKAEPGESGSFSARNEEKHPSGQTQKVWKALKKFFPAKNNESYLVMLQALCKLNDIEGLKEMFEELESVCSKYDMGLANVAILGYPSQGMHGEAELIFANACKKTKGQERCYAAEKFCKILKRLGCLSCNEYCLLLKTYIAAGKSDPAMRQRLNEEHIEISPELEILLKKVSASELTG
ncbi:unnamed protein product [Malus baccata var. baccata]